jgi:excisionase family DNA binding protein
MNSERFTFDEACRELGVTEEELEQLVAAGEIASIKDGDTLFFKKDVLRKFKKNRESTPTILLSDEEINLLEEAPEEVELLADEGKPAKAGAGGKKAAPTEALAQTGALGQQAPAKAESSRVEIPLDDDLDLEDIEIRTPGEGPESGETKKLPGGPKKVKEPASISEDETLVSFDGLLEEDSEATTPVPGAVEDDSTLLDTDLLDLGGQTDPFASDTVEETVGTGATEAGTLLRGGGARVMQMKRKQGHPLLTVVLALSCILLLLPLGIVTNLLFAHSEQAKDTMPAKDSYGWIMDFNVLDGVVEGVADLFKK